MTYLRLFIILLLIIVVVSATICKMYQTNTLYKEGFTWSLDDFHKFENFRKLSLPNTQFDLEMLQQQASPEELSFLVQNGFWPWREQTKSIFLDEIGKNKIIKADPTISLDYYQKRYNDTAIRKLLGWNTNEGQFILRGVTTPDGNKYQCKENDDRSISMYKMWSEGYNLWNGYEYLKKEKVSNEALEQEIPGFSYVNGPCNPCDNLEVGKSCAFHLQLEKDKEISPIWKMNWGIVGF